MAFDPSVITGLSTRLFTYETNDTLADVTAPNYVPSWFRLVIGPEVLWLVETADARFLATVGDIPFPTSGPRFFLIYDLTPQE